MSPLHYLHTAIGLGHELQARCLALEMMLSLWLLLLLSSHWRFLDGGLCGYWFAFP